MVKDNRYRTLETDQRGGFIHKKWLNVSKHSELCGILTCLIASPFPQLHNSLENKWHHIHSENPHLGSHWKGKMGAATP